MIVKMQKLLYSNNKDEADIFWNNKEVIKNSILLWDLRDISFRKLEAIKGITKYTPARLLVVSDQPLSEKLINRMNDENFKIFVAHKTKIIKIMQQYENIENITLISSDSIFIKEASVHILNNKLHWIMTDSRKGAIIMKMNVASPNLTISTLLKKENKKQVVINSNKASLKKIFKKKIKYIKWLFIKLLGLFNTNKSTIVQEKRIKVTQVKDDEQDKRMSKKNIIAPNNPYMGKRKVFMQNPNNKNKKHKNGKKERCGTLTFCGKNEKILTLYPNLLKIFSIENFTKDIKFNDFKEVEDFIVFKEMEREYYLKKFPTIV